MKKFKHIVWDQKYSVHVEAIDIQNQELFPIVNRIINLYESGSKDYYPMLQELANFIPKHFHAEHMIMKKTNYPDFWEHSQEHQAFIEKFQEYLKNYEGRNEQLDSDMLTFLHDLVFSHTLKSDLKYGEHLTKTLKEERKSTKESRKSSRLATSIEAAYWKLDSFKMSGKIQKATIINLSLGGCLLTQKNHMIDLHSKIHLVFKLDNNRRTKIEREAVVCRVTENHIGCKFIPNVHGSEPDFVSYILHPT